MRLDIKLEGNHREAVVELLNRMVGDEFILSTKTRNWHWNATDPPFHDLHKFFDVQYEERDAMENP